MRTAIDTNVISTLWARQPACETAERMLLRARQQGGLVICGAVYAELLGYREVQAEFVDAFLARGGIEVDAELGRDVWRDAGTRFARYCARRKKSMGGEPRRLLADFIIGSHAWLRADRLLTFNEDDYRPDYPELRLADRSAAEV